MKKYRWIALLSAVVCASSAFVACDKDDSSASGSGEAARPVVPPTAATVVDATFSNFVKAEYKADWFNLNGEKKLLNNEYGTLQDSKEHFYLFMKKDRTPLDEISETWTIYNAKTKSVTWTQEFKYQNGDYTGKDEYGFTLHAPLERKISLKNFDGDLPYIKIITTQYERYTDEQIQEQIDMYIKYSVSGAGVDFEPRAYKETYSTDYYSIDGQLICNLQEYVEDERIYCLGDSYEEGFRFFKTGAKFDKDGNLLETWDMDTTDRIVPLKKTDAYYYVTSVFNGETTIEAYDNETDELVYRYPINALEMMFMGGMPNVLQDGDLLVQSKEVVTGGEYDMMLSSGIKYDLVTERIDIETGKIEEMEFPYEIVAVYSKDEFAVLLGDELQLTENVYNVALANKLEDGVAGKSVYVFFDNLLNVQYEWSTLVPGQEFNLEEINIDVLKTGELLIDFATPVTVEGQSVSQAIVKANGEFVGYVPENAIVMEDCIIVGKEVFAFDGKKVDELHTSYFPEGYIWEESISFGGAILVEGKYVNEETGAVSHVVRYNYKTTDSSGQVSFSDSYFYGTIAEDPLGKKLIGKNYVVLYNETDKVYYVYGSSMANYVFTCTELPTIEEYDGSIVITLSDGGEKKVVYEISTHTSAPSDKSGY